MSVEEVLEAEDEERGLGRMYFTRCPTFLFLLYWCAQSARLRARLVLHKLFIALPNCRPEFPALAFTFTAFAFFMVFSSIIFVFFNVRTFAVAGVLAGISLALRAKAGEMSERLIAPAANIVRYFFIK